MVVHSGRLWVELFVSQGQIEASFMGVVWFATIYPASFEKHQLGAKATKMATLPHIILRYYKSIGNLLLWVHWECFIMPSSNDSISPCRKLWCPKCWNQLVMNFDVYVHAKNQLDLYNFFFEILWRHCEKLLFYYFE